MCVRQVFLIICSLVLFGTGAIALDQGDDDYDKELAVEINYTCAGCHGEYGQGVADGTYPRLAGLRADYLARQLRLFKSRERLNIPMFPYATERELPEEDVLAIAQYLSRIKLLVKMPQIDEARYDPLERLKLAKRVFKVLALPGDVKNGRKFYIKECGTCHGRKGLGKQKKPGPGGAASVYPRLAGQHPRYLLRQIKAIAKGTRFHDEKDDDEVFRSYSQKEINDALAYLSTLEDR